MSPKHFPIRVLLCALALMPALAQNRNVFVMPPGDGVLRPVSGYSIDPFNPVSAAISAAQDTFTVVSTPSASKYYFIGRSATDTVVITDANFNIIGRRSLGIGASAAAISPDGRYVVIAAGTVQILDSSTDQLIGQVDAGGNVNDVAISRDGLRAFATSLGSNRVSSIDLASRTIINTQSTLSAPAGVTVGPNAFVYVSGTNILYELDPRDLSIRGGTAIGLNAQPGKPVVFGDAQGVTRVLLANLNPIAGGSVLISVDLGTRQAIPVAAISGVVFDQVVPVSANRAYARTSGQQLYQIDLPSAAGLANISGVNSSAGVRFIAASSEANPRFLFIANSATNAIQRVDLASNTVAGSFSLASAPGPLAVAGATATGTPSALYLYNNGQFINPSSQSLPLVIRAVDGTGRPLTGVPVQFSTIAPGAFITSANAATDGEGYAQAIVISPPNLGPFNVTVSAGSGIVTTGTYNLNVGTGTTGPTGAVVIRGGNGQVIRELSLTPELLRVLVRDTAGNPVQGALVTWAVTATSDPGTLSATQTVTDNNGEAVNTFIGPFLGPNRLVPYVQSTITASTFSGSATFYVTTIPNFFGQNPSSLPTVTILQPSNTDTIRAQAGTTLTGAIQARVQASAGPSSGQAIPNVGISVTTGLDPTLGPSARCSGDSGLSDAAGIATCNIIIGSRIGTTPLNIVVGGATQAVLNLVVTPGLPGAMIPTQGDNQSGAPGQTLPLALVARVEDSFGNVLPGTPVTWTVESGSATLLNTIGRSDSNGRVSTLVQLGNSAGQVRIRVTAQGGTATATTAFTANVNITATQIRRVSGDDQAATINTAFSAPLVAQVFDAGNQPVANVPVTFRVTSGTATLSPATATSDSTGTVRTNVTAGGTPGTVTIAAELAGTAISWTLTVRPIGPTLDASGITNAATGQTQIAPGSVILVRGRNITQNVQGYVVPASDFGPRPTTLGGATVTFGGVAAPIFWVSNIGGQETISAQVPFEAPEGTSVPVTVQAGGAPVTVNVPISAVAPGVFESTDGQGRRFAVITRQDGTFVTPDNPIGRGEMARAWVTGLGRTSVPANTNAPGGVAQRVNAAVIVGVNDGGVDVMSAEYAQNLIGVYVVTFRVPDTTPSGLRSFVVAADQGGGNLLFSNGSNIAIR